MSSNGTYIAAVTGSTTTYISSDSGKTFITYTTPAFSLVTLSASGQFMSACQSNTNSNLYLSSDFGVTWEAADVPSAMCQSLSTDASGFHLMASYKTT
eukprot:gene30738-37996_t